MWFNLYGILFNMLFAVTFTVCVGMILGNLKCLGRMKLGVGGSLFVGIFVGWGLYELAQWILSVGVNGSGFWAKFITPSAIRTIESVSVFKDGVLTGVKIVPSTVYNFMLVLFVAAVGLLASKDLNIVLKKYGAKFVALGLIITLLGAVASYATIFIYDKTNIDEATGVFTGALTSSPGLSAGIEKAEKFTREKSAAAGYTEEETTYSVEQAIAGVNIGYSIGYPFGMIAVILAMTLLPKIFKINVKGELEAYRHEITEMRKNSNTNEIEPITFEVKSFMLVILTGCILGQIEIPMGSFGSFSLGSTGGVLIAAVIFGYIGKIGNMTFRMDDKVLGAVRDVTLSCYIGMMGINYGNEVIKAFIGNGIYFVIASLTIALICILAGFIIGKYLFKINYIMLSGAICGGMTSTPGLGMAIDATGSDEPAAGYAATYPFALIGMVLFIILMYNLPH